MFKAINTCMSRLKSSENLSELEKALNKFTYLNHNIKEINIVVYRVTHDFLGSYLNYFAQFVVIM